MFPLNKLILLWVVLVVSLLYHPCFLLAGPLGFTGAWRYLESGGDAGDTWSFNETYNLYFAKDLSAGMDFSSAVRYGNSRRAEGNDTKLISPSAALDLRNDLFSFNLSANESWRDTSGGPTLDTKSWNANWLSLLEKWPRVRLNYGQSYSSDDQRPPSQDSESSYLGASLDHSWSIVKFFYDFRTDSNTDRITERTSDTDRHFANLQLSKDFFQRRLSVTVGQKFSSSETETLALGAGGQFLVPITIQNASSGIDDTPLQGALTDNPLLIDGDKVSSAGVEIAQVTQAQNMALRVFTTVNRIRVFLDQEINLATQGILNWELYESNNEFDWTVISLNPTIQYRVENGRTVVDVEGPFPAREFRTLKVVVRPSLVAALPVFVTELVAERLSTGDTIDISKFVQHRTEMSLSYRPLPNWSLGYNLSHERNRPDPGLDSTRLTHSLRSSYSPNRYFSTSVGVNENREETHSQEEQMSRSYSFSINSSPLQTLDLSMGFTRSESYESGTQISTADLLTGYAVAAIFPALSASLTTTWTHSQTYDTGADATTLGWRLNSTARLSPRLDLDAHYEYTSSDQEGGESETSLYEISNRYGLGLSYRPSDILLAHSTIVRDEEEGTTSFSGIVSWRLTPKLQTNGTCSLDLSRGDSQIYDVSLNWSISRHFSFSSSFGYQIADTTDSRNLLASLNATF
jgi:hypothetical protein